MESIQYEDGTVYTGEVLNGLKHGQGKLSFANGTCYAGRFVEDFYEGYGKLRESDMLYEGMFIKGEKCGNGRQHNKMRSYRYEGGWKANLKNGHGVENYPDGSHYEGQYNSGKKHGKGKMTLTNGSIYDGEFNIDKIEGTVSFCLYRDALYGQMDSLIKEAGRKMRRLDSVLLKKKIKYIKVTSTMGRNTVTV